MESLDVIVHLRSLLGDRPETRLILYLAVLSKAGYSGKIDLKKAAEVGHFTEVRAKKYFDTLCQFGAMKYYPTPDVYCVTSGSQMMKATYILVQSVLEDLWLREAVEAFGLGKKMEEVHER